MPVATKISVLCLLFGFVVAGNCDVEAGGHSHIFSNPSYSGLPEEEIHRIVSELKSKIKGQVYAKGTSRYEFHRPVHNGACSHLFPLMIAVPESSEDVSQIVLTARQYGLETSVRSGGHSFVCQGIKHNSLHVDVSFFFFFLLKNVSDFFMFVLSVG
jgi:hypothetical protein